MSIQYTKQVKGHATQINVVSDIIGLKSELFSPQSIRRGKKFMHHEPRPKRKLGVFLAADCNHGQKKLTINSVHPPDHSVDLIFPVASVTSLHEVCGLLVHATTRGRQLEGPQEVVGGLEVLPNCIDLMDEVLNTDDAVFA